MKIANAAHLESASPQRESNSADNQICRKPKCTEHSCVSQTHSSDECFAKPKNFGARDKWISEMDAKRRNGTYRPAKPYSSGIPGMKKVTMPTNMTSANASFASFHVSYQPAKLDNPLTEDIVDETYWTEEVNNDETISTVDLFNDLPEPSTMISPVSMMPLMALHNVFSEGTMAANLVKDSGDWALFDTGSSDHVFKSETLFGRLNH